MFHFVRDFHYKFGLSPLYGMPALLENKEQLYRLARMLEELHEFQKAYLLSDLVKASDALADLVYFALGTADLMNLPFKDIFQAVHAANMNKIGVDGPSQSKYGDRRDIVKPEGWVSPEYEIKHILEGHGYVPPK